MKNTIRDTLAFSMDCFFDLDARTARTRMQEAVDRLIDPRTRRVRSRDVSPGNCFRLVGDAIRSAMMQYESLHPEVRQRLE